MNIIEKINRLKREQNAVILAHYYECAGVTDHADIVGDSFTLAKKAVSLDAETIVVCGVRFMAESVKLLNPQKRVLLPSPDAGCPMADSITAHDIQRLRSEHPNAAVVCYVNSTAAVKAECDICCTSSNAVDVVKSLKADTVIFVPDANLGKYVAAHVPYKKFIYFGRGCPIHNNITPSDVLAAKNKHPSALFAVHPECPPEVVAMADYVGSTAGIIDFACQNSSRDVIVGTEEAIVSRLRSMMQGNEYILLSPSFVCPDMKKTTVEVLCHALENGTVEVTLPESLIQGASVPLRRMISI